MGTLGLAGPAAGFPQPNMIPAPIIKKSTRAFIDFSRPEETDLLPKSPVRPVFHLPTI
jgi:hypothetical protein